MNKKNGGLRPGAGRKPKPKEEHLVYIQITLTHEQRDFVKAQKGGASKYFRKLIEADNVFREFVRVKQQE